MDEEPSMELILSGTLLDKYDIKMQPIKPYKPWKPWAKVSIKNRVKEQPQKQPKVPNTFDPIANAWRIVGEEDQLLDSEITSRYKMHGSKIQYPWSNPNNESSEASISEAIT